MDRGAGQATVHGVAKDRTWLSKHKPKKHKQTEDLKCLNEGFPGGPVV